MNKRWQNSSSIELEFDECYSSWTHPRNLIEQDESFQVTSSSSLPGKDHIRVPGLAINGFHINMHKYAFFSKRIDLQGLQWWMIDLNRIIRLDFVVVILNNETSKNSFFSGVLMRLGNSENYFENPIIYTKLGNDHPDNVPITLKPSNPSSGQFLSFESSLTSEAYDYLAIGELQIIEKKN